MTQVFFFSIRLYTFPKGELHYLFVFHFLPGQTNMIILFIQVVTNMSQKPHYLEEQPHYFHNKIEYFQIANKTTLFEEKIPRSLTITTCICPMSILFRSQD